jgi:transposase
MSGTDYVLGDQSAIRTDLAAIFVSLELSRRTWLVTSLLPGSEKMSRHAVGAGALGDLLTLLGQRQATTQARSGREYRIVAIQEAGLDGFWLHRALEAEGIESHVVDAASIAAPRRRRRAKSDRIDGESLLRVLLAYKRGEPRVCSMVRPPSPATEDRRRVSRERKTLVAQRIAQANRIKGLLFAQGVSNYEPRGRYRHERLEALMTGDGRPLPEHLKRQLGRELERLELVEAQIKQVEAERDALLASPENTPPDVAKSRLTQLTGVGPEFASLLVGEAFWRRFDNRRQLAAYAGLAPTPWKSGAIDFEQGISKAGNPRLRTTMIQLAWLWLRHQPRSELSRWFHDRVRQGGGRIRKTGIVALARKLLIALWRFELHGEPPAGAKVKPA